jgi:hypothetical protein
MKSLTTSRFWRAYADLPPEVKVAARKQYRLWKNNPRHPSLQFKKAGPFWSARITEDHRSLALLRNNTPLVLDRNARGIRANLEGAIKFHPR